MTTLRDAAQQALGALETVLSDAYHRRFQECCGRPGIECCGNPNEAWTPEDNKIMDLLSPAQRQLSDALRAALAEPAEQEAVAPQQQQQQQLKRTHPLDVPLEVFLADLTTRPANVIRLELTGLFDGEPLAVRHLCMFSRKEMKRWPNFGKKCLNEVEELLRARGLRLWESHDERSLRLLHEHKEYFL